MPNTRTPEQNQNSYGKDQKYFEQTVIANHQNIYLFDRAVYVNNDTDVELGCKQHGVYFKVKAMTMLRRTVRNGGKKKNPIVGSCPECRKEYFAEIKNDILQKCRTAHNNEYQYRNYINFNTGFKAVCKKHGEFDVRIISQKDGMHRKCPRCYGINRNPEIKYRSEQKYYICEIHGDVAIGKNRLAKHGCPTCNVIENNRRQNEIYVQRVNKTFGKDYDIFITEKYVEFRCKKHQTRTTVKRDKVGGGIHARKGYCDECKNEEIVEKGIRLEAGVRAKLKSDYNGYYEFIEMIPANKLNDSNVRLKTLRNHGEKNVRAASIIDGSLSKNHRRQLKKNYLSYEEAKNKMRLLGITSFRQYQKWYKRVEQDNLPANIFRFYCDNGGWVSYNDFFGAEVRDQMSAGEKRIADYLDRKTIGFEFQKRYQDCRDKNVMPFDFYLPDYNLIIEFDGYQHYYEVRQFGKLDYIQRHDVMKTEYCQTNGINIIRIPYWELEDNVVEWTLDIEIDRLAARQAGVLLKS